MSAIRTSLVTDMSEVYNGCHLASLVAGCDKPSRYVLGCFIDPLPSSLFLTFY